MKRRMSSISLVFIAQAAAFLPAGTVAGGGIRPVSPHRCATLRLQLDEGDDGVEDSLDETEEYLDALDDALRAAASGAAAPPNRRVRERLSSTGTRRRQPRVLRKALGTVRGLSDELQDSYSRFQDEPAVRLSLGTLSLLVGWWVAEGLTPGVVGQGGYWEYVAGIVAMVAVERITEYYWKRPNSDRSTALQLLQAFKVGFVYGCVVDAIKYAG